MDTCTRGTLIARSTRSLSGVLIASILGLSTQMGTAAATEIDTLSSSNKATASVESTDITDHVPETPAGEAGDESDDLFLSERPTSEEDEPDAAESESDPESADLDYPSNTIEVNTEEPQFFQPVFLAPFLTEPEVVQEEPDLLYEDTYVLGPQDQIQIDIFNVPEFSGANGEHTILIDGTANFPWIGNISLQGLTLNQAADRLEQEYSPYINEPLITVRLMRPRAIRISVVGEVNRPGSYTLDPIERVVERVNNVDAAEGNNQWTSLIQAIQTAGGITPLANVRDIQIQRPSRPEDEQIISVSLWDLLQNGDIRQDLTLRDGDTVYIPRATAVSAEEYLEVADANFSPDTITAYVIGEVKEPGLIEVRPSTTVTQAILAAGGFENDRAGRVEIVRLNPDGTMEKRDVDVDFAAALNEETNPVLRDRDIIIIGRSTGARIVDFLDILFTPVSDVLDTVFDVFPIDLFDGGDDD